MRRSEDRILTTHTGSLPRPSELTRLYVRRARGESVDPTELDRLGREALQWVVRKQAEAGVDIGNNGEQQREGFFLHIRHRMSGFGGSWQRRTRADALRYPVFKRMMEEQLAAREAVSNMGPPKAIGEIRYLGTAAIDAECTDFRTALDETDTHFVEPFVTAPSPGIIAGAMKNEHYDTEEAYLDALGAALKPEYETIVQTRLSVAARLPRSGARAPPLVPGPPARRFPRLCRARRRDDQQGVGKHPARPRSAACLLGQLRGAARLRRAARRHPAGHQQANVGAFFFPFANPRHAHEYRVFEKLPLADDQIIIGGVIDSLTNFVEHPEAVADRLERLAAAIGDPHRVIAGTDCGFDTSAGMGRVAEDVVWAKLKSLAEGARIASRRFGMH